MTNRDNNMITTKCFFRNRKGKIKCLGAMAARTFTVTAVPQNYYSLPCYSVAVIKT